MNRESLKEIRRELTRVEPYPGCRKEHALITLIDALLDEPEPKPWTCGKCHQPIDTRSGPHVCEIRPAVGDVWGLTVGGKIHKGFVVKDTTLHVVWSDGAHNAGVDRVIHGQNGWKRLYPEVK